MLRSSTPRLVPSVLLCLPEGVLASLRGEPGRLPAPATAPPVRQAPRLLTASVRPPVPLAATVRTSSVPLPAKRAARCCHGFSPASDTDTSAADELTCRCLSPAAATTVTFMMPNWGICLSVGDGGGRKVGMKRGQTYPSARTSLMMLATISWTPGRSVNERLTRVCLIRPCRCSDIVSLGVSVSAANTAVSEGRSRRRHTPSTRRLVTVTKTLAVCDRKMARSTRLVATSSSMVHFRSSDRNSKATSTSVSGASMRSPAPDVWSTAAPSGTQKERTMGAAEPSLTSPMRRPLTQLGKVVLASCALSIASILASRYVTTSALANGAIVESHRRASITLSHSHVSPSDARSTERRRASASSHCRRRRSKRCSSACTRRASCHLPKLYWAAATTPQAASAHEPLAARASRRGRAGGSPSASRPLRAV
mmetsp:Transcript_2663/g.7978  ORF Transcript_2663/g.7978 Transcript_2663/m.7978 type:complete len:425 (-) Transcript_2663:82-1356(-)